MEKTWVEEHYIIFKRKIKTPQIDFLNFTAKASCFYITGKDPITKSSKYESKWLISISFGKLIWKKLFVGINFRGGSRAAATSKMKHFVIIVNGLSR